MVLFLLCLISSIFGLVAISTATASFDTPRYVIVQTIGLLMGIVLYIVFTVIDIDIFADKWAILLVFSVLLELTLLTPLGYADNTGNRAWLRLGPIGIQPTEVMKVLFIIILAKQLTYLKTYRDLNSPTSVLQLLLHCAFILGLIFVVSRDMGSALVFLFIFIIMLYAAGLRFYWFIVGLAAIAAVTPLFWTRVLNQRYRDRILAPFDNTIDPNGTGIRWQSNQSKIALANGQLTGTGLGNGSQTQSELLPAKQTDFIFSVIGEELGLIACVIVFLLLLIIIFRCIWVGAKSGDTLSMLVCFGVAGSLIFQTFENIGMCIGVAPVIGITLPFFSYGGSSVFATFAAVGLVSGIKYRPKPHKFRTLY